MNWWQELLKHESVAVALISAVASIALIVFGWATGFWKVIGKQIEEWLKIRREESAAAKRSIPKRTLHVVPSSSILRPYWTVAQISNVEQGTVCNATLTVTNLTRAHNVIVDHADVKFFTLFPRRRARHVRIVGPRALHGEQQPPGAVGDYQLNLQVAPMVKEGSRQRLRGRVTVYDHLGNGHSARIVFVPIADAQG